jgi:hypothetical protein
MFKDLFGGKTIEVPCKECGSLFPQYNEGTEQLYCGIDCKRDAT